MPNNQINKSKAIRYNLELDDWVKFSRYHSKNQSCQKRFFKIVWLGVPVFLGIFALFVALSDGVNIFSGFLVILAILFLIFLPSIDENLSLRMLKRILAQNENKYWLGSQELTLTPEHIMGKNEASEAKYQWKTVNKIEVTDTHMYIYINSVSAIVVPRKGIIEGSFDEIVCSASEFWKISKNPSSE